MWEWMSLPSLGSNHWHLARGLGIPFLEIRALSGSPIAKIAPYYRSVTFVEQIQKLISDH